MTIILDANLLLLLVVGSADRSFIAKHKRLRSYTDEDFDLLLLLLSRVNGIIVTPNTLTETSNLAGYISDPARTVIYQMFRAIVQAPATAELSVESKLAVSGAEFVRLGLTDSVLLHLATGSHTLLTADVDLYLAATTRGLKAENFNHFRNL